MRGDVPFVDGAGIPQAVHNLEVVGRTANDGGQLEVAVNGGQQRVQFMTVRAAKIEVVVEDGAGSVGLLQQGEYLWADGRGDGVVGTEEHHIVGLYLRHGVAGAGSGVRLVELVVGVVVRIEIGQ